MMSEKLMEAIISGKKVTLTVSGGFAIDGFASVEQEARISYIRAVKKYRIDFLVNDKLVKRDNYDNADTIKAFFKWNNRHQNFNIEDD